MKKEINLKVGDILKQMRLEAGLSTESVFEKTDCLSLNDLIEIESGKISIRCFDLIQLIELYKPSDELLILFCTSPIEFFSEPSL